MKRPLLRYNGGKWRIAPWIIQHFPPHNCYVESFGGGGSVLLRKPPCEVEVYNDLNSEIVNLFRVLREHPQELIHTLKFTPYSREELRLSDQRSLLCVEQARRTLVRYRSSRNPDGKNPGNSLRIYSIDSQATLWKAFVDDLDWIIDRLRSVTIEHHDAEWVIKAYDKPWTLHYIDPPYDPETRGISYTHEFSTEQFNSLSELLHSVKGFVVVSGYRSPAWDRAFEDFERRERQTINVHNKPRSEVLWLSPRTAAKLKIRRVRLAL